MRIEPGTKREHMATGLNLPTRRERFQVPERVNPCVPIVGVIAVFCAVVSLTLAANAQMGNSVKGFKTNLQYFPPPHELQVQSYLEGTSADFLPNGMIGFHEAKLHTYREDGSV